MAAYADADDLARVATDTWRGLAQLASPDAAVDGELLAATAHGDPREAWSPAAQAAADTALALLQEQLERASRHADTFLAPRYRAVLPLAAELIAGSDLPTVVATIAYRRLFGSAADKAMLDATAWADAYLRDLAAGRASLGAADTATAQPPGRVVTRAPAKNFDWDGY